MRPKEQSDMSLNRGWGLIFLWGSLRWWQVKVLRKWLAPGLSLTPNGPGGSETPSRRASGQVKAPYPLRERTRKASSRESSHLLLFLHFTPNFFPLGQWLWKLVRDSWEQNKDKNLFTFLPLRSPDRFNTLKSTSIRREQQWHHGWGTIHGAFPVSVGRSGAPPPGLLSLRRRREWKRLSVASSARRTDTTTLEDTGDYSLLPRFEAMGPGVPPQGSDCESWFSGRAAFEVPECI